MTKTISWKRLLALTSVFAAAWTGLLFASSPFDLPLSRAVFDQNAIWALWIQDHGTLPGIIFWVVSLIFLAACVPPRSPFRRLPTVQKISIATLLMGPLHPIFITSVIKAFVGRPRFIQLEGEYSLFTHFFQMNQSLSGVSFPSGHVATAVILFPAAVILWREGRGRIGAILFALTVAWGVFTAAARIVAGAHYLTDTLFSFGLALLLSPLVGNAATSLWSLMFHRKTKPDQVTPSS